VKASVTSAHQPWRVTTPPNPVKPVTNSTRWQNFQVDVWGASVRPGSPFDFEPATMSRITPQGPTVPWTPLDTNGNTWWGDYQSMTATNGTFITTWADDRGGASGEALYAASFGP